jgi:hypothetical protein
MIKLRLRRKVITVAKDGDEIVLSDRHGNALNWDLTQDEFETICQSIASHGDAQFHRDAAPDALQLLVDAINSAGGVCSLPNGSYAPNRDSQWIDLGDAYIAACSELGLLPLIANDNHNGNINPQVAGRRKKQNRVR